MVVKVQRSPPFDAKSASRWLPISEIFRQSALLLFHHQPLNSAVEPMLSPSSHFFDERRRKDILREVCILDNFNTILESLNNRRRCRCAHIYLNCPQLPPPFHLLQPHYCLCFAFSSPRWIGSFPFSSSFIIQLLLLTCIRLASLVGATPPGRGFTLSHSTAPSISLAHLKLKIIQLTSRYQCR